jgi:hypothetical protein
MINRFLTWLHTVVFKTRLFVSFGNWQNSESKFRTSFIGDNEGQNADKTSDKTDKRQAANDDITKKKKNEYHKRS